MTGTIKDRELITISVDGINLSGTYHRPYGEGCPLPESAGAKNRTLVLFLNPGFLPRAGHADSAVYWADSLARSGYPALRLDLPGLGDSDGEVPEKLLDFINAGGYAPLVSGAIKDLVQRFSFAGVVLIGLCAGSVSALYTAASTKECRGVVMLDPYFFLSYERTKLREEFSHFSSWSRLGALISNVYDRTRYLRLLLRGNRLPRNANLPLLRSWSKLASARVPILVLKAPGLKTAGIRPRVGEFDYLQYLQASSGNSSRIQIRFVEGTNHSFADDIGRTAVRDHFQDWMNSFFSLPDVKPAPALAPSVVMRVAQQQTELCD